MGVKIIPKPLPSYRQFGKYSAEFLIKHNDNLLALYNIIIPLWWWGRGDSNPYALRHMILSHARLPIPTLPQTRNISTPCKKYNQHGAFLTPEGKAPQNTLLFYQRCLSKAIGIELTPKGTNCFLDSLTCK